MYFQKIQTTLLEISYQTGSNIFNFCNWAPSKTLDPLLLNKPS